MVERAIRVSLIGDATSLIAAAGQARTALTGLANTNLGTLRTGIQGVGSASQAAAGQVTTMGSAMKIGLGVVGVQAGLMAITQGIRAFMSAGLEYQANMNTLHAVTGATTEQMAALSAQAIKLGNDVRIPGISASDAAQGMKELAKAGLSVDQAIKASTGTMMLAVAAQVDAGRAAQIQANALNAFGLSAQSAGHVADLLANAANASSGEVTDMAAALQQSATVASSFGISIDDTVTTLALFAKNGVLGSDAGTSFKTMLVQLASPTKQQAKALDDLNLKVYDAKGNFVGMRSVATQLGAAHQKLTTQQYELAAGVVFGTDAIRTANVLGREGAAAFDEMGNKVEKVGGAQILAAAQMEGLNGALANLSNFAENAGLTMFNALQPAMVAVVDLAGIMVAGLGLVANVFAAMPGPINVFVLGLAAAVLLEGPLNKLATMIRVNVVTAVQVAKFEFAAMRVSMAATATSFELLKVAGVGAMTAIKSAFMSNPIGLTIVAATTLISLFLSLKGSTDDTAASMEGATAAVHNLGVALQQSGGQVTAAVREAALQSILAETDGVKGLTGFLDRLNVSRTTGVDAMVGEAGAADTVESAYQRQTKQLQAIVDIGTTAGLGGKLFQSQTAKDAQAAIDALNNEHAAWLKILAASPAAAAAAQANADAINGVGSAAGGAVADVEAVAKAIEDVNKAMGSDMSAIYFNDVLDKSKVAADALKLSSEGLTAALLGVAGGEVAAAAAARGRDAAMRGIGTAARSHESALRGVATAQEALDKLQAHGTNTAEDVANAQKSADKAAKDVLTSQQDLIKAQEKAAQDLSDARAAAVKTAAEDAKTEKTDREDIAKAQIDANKDVKDAEKQLAKDKADGAKKVAEERAAAEKDRLATAKALADAQNELTKARDSAAREIALAQARVDKLAGNKRYSAADRADAARRLADAKALGQNDINTAQGKVTDVTASGNESAASHRASLNDLLAKNRETVAADEQAIVDARSKGAEAVKAAQDKLAEDVAKSAEDQAKSQQSIADAVQSGADSVTQAQQRIIDATDSAASAAANLADEQGKSVPSASDLAAAQAAVADANARVSDTADGQADALDKAGQAARDAAAAAYEKAGGDANAQAAAQAAGDEMGVQRQKFIDSAMAAGFGADEANRLADEQHLIPKDVVTTYAQSGHEGALLKAKQLNEALNAIPGVKKIQFIVDGSTVLTVATNTPLGQPAPGIFGQIPGMQLPPAPGPYLPGTPQNPLPTPPAGRGRTSGGGGTFAIGGFVTGPGGPTDDAIAAHLSNGEFVVNAAQTGKHRDLLEQINNATNGYAAGGPVGKPATADVAMAIQGAVVAPDLSAVDQAWGGVGDSMAASWDGTMAPTLDALNEATLQTGQNFTDLQTNAVEPSWAANAAAVTSAATGTILPMYDTLNAGTVGVGQAHVDLRDAAVNPAWAGISATVTGTAGVLTGATFPTMVGGLQGLGNTGRTLAADTGTSWGSIGTSINTAYTDHVVPAWTGVQGFSTATGSFFGGVNTGMATTSTGVTTNLGTITKAIDEFFKMVDGKAPATTTAPTVPTVPTVPKLADGGMITAGTGPRTDDVHIRASKGEYVVNAKSTAAHRAELDKINYGGKYADGGEVGTKIGGRISKAIEGGAEKAIEKGVDRVLATVAGGLGSTISGADVDPTSSRGKFLAAVASKMGTAYVWGAAGPDVFDCSGLMSWGLEAAGVGKGRLTADQFNDSFPKVTTPRPGDLVTFDTGRLPGNAGHIGAVMDPAKGLMMHTDGAGPARVSTYVGRDGGPLAFVDPIGGAYVPKVPDTPGRPGDPPSAGWLARVLAKIAAGGTGPSGPGNLIVGPPGVYGATRLQNTVDPTDLFSPMSMSRGTAANVGPVPPGGAEERWRPLYLHAMGMLGKPVGAINKMMYQMHRESSGNPLSYNDTDSNYTHGKPSKGLLQTIPSTFKSNAPAGYNTNIWDPLSNALASLVYIGDPYKYPGGAYDNGGMLQPGWNFNGLNSPEPVLTDSQWAVASRAMNYTMTSGSGGGTGPVTVNARVFVGNTEITDIARVEAEMVFDSGMTQLGTTLTRQAAQS